MAYVTRWRAYLRSSSWKTEVLGDLTASRSCSWVPGPAGPAPAQCTAARGRRRIPSCSANFIRQLAVADEPGRLYHYRDRDNHEVDTALEAASGEVLLEPAGQEPRQRLSSQFRSTFPVRRAAQQPMLMKRQTQGSPRSHPTRHLYMNQPEQFRAALTRHLTRCSP
jgi:hypothetical protein